MRCEIQKGDIFSNALTVCKYFEEMKKKVWSKMFKIKILYSQFSEYAE